MKPAFRIRTDDHDLTAEIAKRLISLSVKDRAGIADDSLQIVLRDNPPIALPKPGIILHVALGYEEQLVEVGSFAIKPVSLKIDPGEMSIEGSAADQYGTLMGQRERSWKSENLKSIVEAIAKEHALEPSVSKVFASITISHEDQTESDIALLTRLAKRHDAIFKIQGRKLGFLRRGRGESASGTKIGPFRIESARNIVFKTETESKYSGVRAHYWNARHTRRESVVVGKEGRIHDLRYCLKDESTAKEAANSKFREIKRKSSILNFEVPGTLEIHAERELEISGFRQDIDGIWIVSEVDYDQNGSGFIDKVTCERKIDE